MKFVCENCGKKFDQLEECKNHENLCMTNNKQYVHLKYIMVYPDIDDYDVYIYEYPKAIKTEENYYFLNPYDDIKYEPEFDTVIISDYTNPMLYIVTENLDPIYEDECMKKLLNHKLILAKEEYERIGKSIKNFSTNNYAVSRKMI